MTTFTQATLKIAGSPDNHSDQYHIMFDTAPSGLGISGCPMGRGLTVEAAINDLIHRVESCSDIKLQIENFDDLVNPELMQPKASNDKHMTGTSDVYKTVYANTNITVRLFQSPELEQGNGSKCVYQAVVTFISEDGTTRQDLDTLDDSHVEHCREGALKLAAKNNEQAWGKLHGAYMAQCYWQLIK